MPEVFYDCEHKQCYLDVFYDREERKWKGFDGQRDLWFTDEEFLAGKGFVGFSVVGIESPHLDARGKLSVAQVYTEEELSQLYAVAKRMGVTILASPGKLTPRARTETGFVKADDAKACFGFYNKHPEITLMKWPRKNKHLDEPLIEQRLNHSVRLNEMRVPGSNGDGKYEGPQVEHARRILHDNYDSLSEQVKLDYEIRLVYPGKQNERCDFNSAGIMSLYVTVFNEDGTLRRYNGQPIGKRWIKKVLKQHAFKGRGGTARSNLMFHTLPRIEKQQGMPGDLYGHMPEDLNEKKNKEKKAAWRRQVRDQWKDENQYGVFRGIKSRWRRSNKELINLFQTKGES